MLTLKRNALFIVVMGLCLIFPWATMAEEGSIIKIEGTGGETCTGIAVTPAELIIEKDVIVIWLNAINGDEVNILFDDGNATKTATANAMGFDLDKNGIYAAKYLPFVSTTSLRFTQKGTYRYRVISQNNKFATQGVITVP